MALSSDIVWKKFTSLKGKEFEIGTSPEADTNNVEVEATNVGVVRASGSSFGVDVNWPVASNEWKDTTQEVREKAKIPRYNLYKAGGIYDYRLEFINEDTYHYHFHDEEGDSYSVNTWTTGSHFVRYNSTKPTILYVDGN